MIIGVDPGTVESGYCMVAPDYTIERAGKVCNDELRQMLRDVRYQTVVIESLQSYGMAVGREVFETAYGIGRLLEICSAQGHKPFLYPRPEYAKAICGTAKISDSILYQALRLRFGGDRKGEPLYPLKGASDKRSAFAVAVYHLDLNQ